MFVILVVSGREEGEIFDWMNRWVCVSRRVWREEERRERKKEEEREKGMERKRGRGRERRRGREVDNV